MGETFITLPSGVEYKDIETGKGLDARPGDVVSVHYKASMIGGEEFDNSYTDNEPFTFELGAAQVVPGLEEAIVHMNVGGKRIIRVPANRGYGDVEIGSIPANSDLEFEVELLDIE